MEALSFDQANVIEQHHGNDAGYQHRSDRQKIYKRREPYTLGFFRMELDREHVLI